MHISFKLGCNFSSCCYSVFSTDFPILSPWRVSYIIQLLLDDLDPQFVNRSGHYLSACPIRHLPKPLVNCGNQNSTVQAFSPHKCSQEVWWDALNVVTSAILLVMSGLIPSSKLFFYSVISFGNVPLMQPYCPEVCPFQHDNSPLDHRYDTWRNYVI